MSGGKKESVRSRCGFISKLRSLSLLRDCGTCGVNQTAASWKASVSMLPISEKRDGSLDAQLDYDVAARVQACLCARRNDAGRVVLLDDKRPEPWQREVGAPEDRGLDPGVLRSEPGRTRQRRLGLGPDRTHALGHPRAFAQTLPDDLD